MRVALCLCNERGIAGSKKLDHRIRSFSPSYAERISLKPLMTTIRLPPMSAKTAIQSVAPPANASPKNTILIPMAIVMFCQSTFTVVAGEAIFASVDAAVVADDAIGVVKDLSRQRFLRAGINCGRDQHGERDSAKFHKALPEAEWPPN